MIKQLKLENFTIFENASFSFGKKLNILIGGNGTGKSHILKLLYAWEQGAFSPSLQKPNGEEISAHKYFQTLFKCDDDLNGLINYKSLKDSTHPSQAQINIYFEDSGKQYISKMTIHIPHKMVTPPVKFEFEAPEKIKLSYPARENGLFLQARDMLTIYPRFLSLSQKYNLPYDVTYEDTIVKLGIPDLKEQSDEFAELIHSLEQNIHGKIYLKNERFFYHADDAPKDLEQDVNMLAEGWRKLGEIIQLLRNGELRKGMALFWDEPETNLNPQYIRLIAKVIIKLLELDIQVFIATQSLFLVEELEILTTEHKLQDGIRYFNLKKGQPVQQGDKLSDLKDVLLIDEDLKLSDRFFAKEM